MRRWRVGTFSMGILLVAAGILLLIGQIRGINGAGMILKWWPIILIVLGVEILAYILFSREEQPRIKFDGLSIVMVIFIVLFSSGVYAAESFWQGDFSKTFFNQMGYYQNESVVKKTWDVDAAGVKKLQINNSRGQIEIDSYDGDKIKVDAAIIIRNNNEDKALELAQNLVEVNQGETLVLNTRSLAALGNSKSYQFTINYEVKVPKELIFEINNKYGEINLENLGGSVKVNGQYGQVEVNNIQGDVQIENAYGDTRVKNVTGKVGIDNENGEINYSSKQPARNEINLNCKMGGITVELPRQQPGSFDLLSQFGEITFTGFSGELPLAKAESRQEMKGVLSTTEPLVSAKTDHGQISFQGQ